MENRNQTLITRTIKSGMRLFFRLLYHSLAWIYDLVAATVSVGRWRRWVLAAADWVRGPCVLELGYGPGHLQAELHQRNLQVFGLDESWQMARQASARLRKVQQAPRLVRGVTQRLVRGVAQGLPYASAAFDSVVATFPTPYIVDPQTLAEIRRVLKPGGRLVVLMSAWITGDSPLDRLMAALFQATGESPDEHQAIAQVIAPYQQAGFTAQVKLVEPPGSRLLFILAIK